MATNQRNSLLDDWTSEATQNFQPSKDMNAGSATINWANPESPSTNPATRRAEYNIQNQGITVNNNTVTPTSDPTNIGTTSADYSTTANTITPVSNLTIAPTGSFDLYPKKDMSQYPEAYKNQVASALAKWQSSANALGQLTVQNLAIQWTQSSNVADVNKLMAGVSSAYAAWIFDTNTIANQLWVSPEAVLKVQQGKANELVTLNQDFVEDQLKEFWWQKQDYDTAVARSIENYNLSMNYMNQQYESSMQTLRRNLFDNAWEASVGSAVAGISGSKYLVSVIEAKHQQNVDDLNNWYFYSSAQQQLWLNRAIEDYNKNVERLTSQFDDAIKNIQTSVLTQFQQINAKIGLTEAEMSNILSNLDYQVDTAKAQALVDYATALQNGENTLAEWIKTAYGLQNTVKVGWWTMRSERNNNPTAMITDYAKQLWWVEWVDYERWDSFIWKDWRTYYTAKLIWDPIETTIRLLDRWATNNVKKNIFTAWTYFNQLWMTNDKWLSLTRQEKENFILKMLKHEWWDIGKMSYYWSDEYKSLTQQTTTWWEIRSDKLDPSGLTAEQILEANALVTKQLWATQAKSDIITHNAVYEMMRQWMTTDQINDQLRKSSKWWTLDDHTNIKYVVDKLITKKWLTGTSKDEFLDQIQDYVSQWDYTRVLDSLQSSMYDAMTSGNKDSLDAARSLDNYLDDIEWYLEKMVKWWKVTWLEAYAMEQMAEAFWKTSDPQFAEMQNYINSVVQIYRKKITWAAFTESERKEYEKEFPSLFKDWELNQALINSLRKKNNADIENAYNSVLWGKDTYSKLLTEIKSLLNPAKNITPTLIKSSIIKTWFNSQWFEATSSRIPSLPETTNGTWWFNPGFLIK